MEQTCFYASDTEFRMRTSQGSAINSVLWLSRLLSLSLAFIYNHYHTNKKIWPRMKWKWASGGGIHNNIAGRKFNIFLRCDACHIYTSLCRITPAAKKEALLRPLEERKLERFGGIFALFCNCAT